MVSTSPGLSADHPEVGRTRNRPNGNESQHQSGEIRIPLPRGEPNCSGCPVYLMAIHSGLYLSPDSLNTKGINEDSPGSGFRDSGNAILAQEILVHPAHEDEQGVLLEVTDETRSPHSRHQSTSAPEDPQAYSVEAHQPAWASAVSTGVLTTLTQARAKSTIAAYSRIKNLFLHWYRAKGLSSSTPSVPEVLEFLQDGLDRGLSVSTLRVQVAALSAHYLRSFSKDPLVKLFFRGASRLRPRIISPIPQWDLSTVLRGLCGPPFEPLQEVNLKLVSFKLTFLLAITSAKRVSELQALSAVPPYLTFLPDRVLLRFVPFFSPKVPSDKNRNQVISLPSYFPDPSSPDIYLTRTQDFRKTDNLLVLWSGRSKGLKASKPTLSKWVKEAVKEAYLAQELDPPDWVKAHSTRAVSTSWAERCALPLEVICEAASWSAQETFARHYRLDSHVWESAAFGRTVLDAAQHVIPPMGAPC